jgi:predicted nucleic acid-binding protein
MRFVDTNIFLRYLTRDDPIKAAACYALFQRVKHGQETVTSAATIIAEVVYVLSSPRLYHLSHVDIAARLIPLVALRGLHLPRKRSVRRALALYAAHSFLDFEDALTVASMERRGLAELYSYDADFDQLAGVTRYEP